MEYEYCWTDGEGTLIGYGVAYGYDEYEDAVLWAYMKGYAIHAEPADKDCQTGQ